MKAAQRGRAVFGVNATVSVALVVLVAAIALVVQPPSPPAIAAFAPQAAKPITNAPPAQSSVTGDGTGACRTGQVCAGPTPSRSVAPTLAGPSSRPTAGSVAGVPSALQCYTWPDGSVTQTFDPQSPPCVATWPEEGQGNGGATSVGVTATAVRVAVPVSSVRSSFDRLKVLSSFFSRRYEFYGRQLQLVPVASQQMTQSVNELGFADPTMQHADAVQIAGQKVFAATDFLDSEQAGALTTYLDTLAARHVVALTGGAVPSSTTVAALTAHQPYEWSYLPLLDQVAPAAGYAACAQLTGRPASHSGAYLTSERSFAIVIPSLSATGDPLRGISGLQDLIERCTGNRPRVISYDPVDQTGNATVAAMNQLKQEGVTTVFFHPWYQYGGEFRDHPMYAADQAQYQPEWIVLAEGNWISGSVVLAPKTQVSHALGIGGFNKLGPVAQEVWFRAYVESGGQPQVTANIIGASGLYYELALLSAGIQAAGPHLTPETFAAGLHQLSFPNPGAGVGPSYQGTVDLSDRPVMVKDFLEFSFDPTASIKTVQDNNKTFDNDQAFCWVAEGTRGGPSAWDRNDRFQSPGRCR